MLPLQEREVLTAVSSQLGIALENLESLENLLRQKTLLESIFEGIRPALPPGARGRAGARQRLGPPAPGRTFGRQPRRRAASGPARAFPRGQAGRERPPYREIILPGGRSLSLSAYP